jgi:16S rRNA (adenine(1408)-N(1))-methyltransferase
VSGAETFRTSASAYDRHVGRYGGELAAALIAFAGVEPGMRALDVGCGSGGLTRALADHGCHVSACDPSATFVAATRERVPGAEVVVAAAEALPPELDGRVDELRLHFPWGSLLRGLLGPEGCVLAGLARLLRPGRCATALLSLTPRDRQPDLPPLDGALAARLAGPYAAHGLRLVDWRPASRAEVAAAHSTWAKRLGAGDTRPVWRLQVLRTT